MAASDDAQSSRARSKSYPRISLREAVARCQVLYEQDGWTEILAETAAVHWGYQGVNGGSSTVLAGVKQFGLIEYSGGGDNLKVKLTELAKRILRPLQVEERRSALQEAMQSPKLYASLYDRFPDWKLPSEATLTATLEREAGIQPKALKSLVANLKDSIAYLREETTVPEPKTDDSSTDHFDSASPPKLEEQGTDSKLDGTEKLYDGGPPKNSAMQMYPMPGGESYVALPKTMTRDEAERTKKWIEKVIIPAIKFAGNLD